MKSIVIREMNFDDLPTVLKIAECLHQESNFKEIPFSMGKVSSTLSLAIEDQYHYTVVFEHEGEIVGGFWAVVQEFYFSNARSANDLAIFILPEKRGLVPFSKLLKHFKNWAVDHGVCRISISQNTGIESERLSKLLTHLGFEYAGSNFFQHV